MKKLLRKIIQKITDFFREIDEELDRIEAERQDEEQKESPVEITRDEEAPQSSTSGSLPSAASDADSADEVPFRDLDFCWGGFNGAKAALTDAVIGGLKVSGSGISYKWLRGGCETLGASSREDAGHTLACLFCLGSDGRWRGGKFDWISTSRTTRDLKNIETGYNGWDHGAFKSAKAYAFVIVSSDGKRRTNVIRC